MVPQPFSWLRTRLPISFYVQHDCALFLGEHKPDGAVQQILPKHQGPTGIEYHESECVVANANNFLMFIDTASYINVLDGRVYFFLELSKAFECPGVIPRPSLNDLDNIPDRQKTVL